MAHFNWVAIIGHYFAPAPDCPLTIGNTLPASREYTFARPFFLPLTRPPRTGSQRHRAAHPLAGLTFICRFRSTCRPEEAPRPLILDGTDQ